MKTKHFIVCIVCGLFLYGIIYFLGNTLHSLLMPVNLFIEHNPYLRFLSKLQQEMNHQIALTVKELQAQTNLRLLASLLGLSFVYGALHALGPGHGKTLLSTWILAKQRSVKEVCFVSLAAALLHALSATSIIAVTYLILGKYASLSTQQLNVDLQLVAAILIIGISLNTLYTVMQTKQTSNLATKRPGHPAWIACSVGLVPCPVTSVIFIFCLTLHLAWLGLLLVSAFAGGMGIALLAISYTVWKIKKEAVMAPYPNLQYFVEKPLPILGSLTLLGVGVIYLCALL
ncbi:HoxN/HupN/NixA family nickel/cobalt transporter [Propionispora hippei]|uniref:Nickel/cobalt efflux system n=1 Tax=Propionispora hippei DSM 15287 TaxID=1123003 RepID=A0A1M6KEQ3_9FIRM|nr:hypothetical protein [Propionispora hippei]SHJ57431.1 ABC-type nickel/cobalt efflux system, permease component RcnA [Propionispora hippei DSM 15287]